MVNGWSALQLTHRLRCHGSIAKTGTAEILINGGTSAINTNVVSYAPSDNPKIAVAVVFLGTILTFPQRSATVLPRYYQPYNQQHPMN